MNCKRCGKPITEQTFALYARRCVPCFHRLPFQRVCWFFTEALPIILGVVLLAPAFIVYAFLRRLWHRFAPVPYRRSEIIRLMTPHFGSNGATKYVNGLRHGFFERRSIRRCNYLSGAPRSKHQSATQRSRCYTIGREDGAWLRRAPKQLQQILDRRCYAPYRLKYEHQGSSGHLSIRQKHFIANTLWPRHQAAKRS